MFFIFLGKVIAAVLPSLIVSNNEANFCLEL